MSVTSDHKQIAPPRSGFSLDLSRTETGPPSLQEKIQNQRRPLTSIMASLLTHTVLLLILLLFVNTLPPPIPRISVLATFEADPVPEHPTDAELNTINIEIPDDNQSPLDLTSNDLANQTDTQIAESPNTVANLIAENQAPNIHVNESPVAPLRTLPTGGGLAGREATARSQRAATRGGSEASELAVEAGLRWILTHQQLDGSWRFHHHKGECNGQCPNEGERESTTAATGLALLALLGAGYTQETGPHQVAVQNGLNYLLRKIRYTPHGGILAEGKDGMYAQAIATMALAEALTMTGDTNLIPAVDEAHKYIVKAQHRGGSWGYNAGSPGDTTLTGWQLMALKSSQLAGFPTEQTTWLAAERFIDSMSSSVGTFGYKSPENVTHATTAVGLLSKMYLGLHKEHHTVVDGSTLLSDYGPAPDDVYFNYYATQVLHHLQGPNWKIWNNAMRDHLIATQVQGVGHADGSWYFEDQHGKVGGRLYTTAMAVMILEVYYRYLPLYEESVIESADGALTTPVSRFP